MELKLEDIKAAMIRLQGQMDVWNNLYVLATKPEEPKNDAASQG